MTLASRVLLSLGGGLRSCCTRLTFASRLNTSADATQRPIHGYEGVVELEKANDNVKKLFSLEFANKRELEKVEVKEVMEKLQRKAFDTGSPEVQIGVLTVRIRNLSDHLKVNKKDYSCKRALQLVLEKRKKQMRYLRKTNPRRYETLLRELGVRPIVDKKYQS
ncbi:small ribosomal subunit protein uS15-like [Oscarella lobularis]|uniref:small ribosomal subunit protein uS15-like n=1 Tax=Oscarella lobularis TaxID=121494 RepID=UPI0033140B02